MIGERSVLVISACLILLGLLPWSFSAASKKPMCREEERSSLLGFKKSFFNETYCSYNEASSPSRIMSWIAGDCCNWDGVKCDDEGDGHVIGLDLSASCLGGRIDSDSTLFDLVRLQDLNLAYNSFDGSPILTALGHHLTRLTRLNLSSSGFVGEVVPEMTRLSNLSSLDLSGNSAMNISSLEEILQILPKIEELDLSYLTILDSKVPRSLGNMTALRSLVLIMCGLSGEFPDSVFELPMLQFVDLSRNFDLTGGLTGFHRGSPIKSLKLSWTRFTGDLPVGLGNLSDLTYIDLSYCRFTGEIPTAIGNLNKLEYFDLSFNKLLGAIPSSLGNLTGLTKVNLYSSRLSGEIPSSLGNLIRLDQLFLGWNQLTGEIPSSLRYLSQLSWLDYGSNMLTGNIPSWISNLTRLTNLDFSSNKFHGPLPDSIYRLPNLSSLRLRSNHLTGVARLDQLLDLKGLTDVGLSFNAFSSIIFPESNASASQIMTLYLDGCELTEVPKFLEGQLELNRLSLSNNNISGQIPEWLLQRNLWYLDLSFNYIRGTLPIPPGTISDYLISNNKLSGEIPSSICEQGSMVILDLANNGFTGVLPSCFVNFGPTLDTLSLSGNNFSGHIPEFNTKQCVLTMIDLSYNSFGGTLPRTLTSCQQLKYVNFGRNKITDNFPSWLGSLSSLKVLMLHSNRFYGLMKAPSNDSWFPSLNIITLSDNNMEGGLPADYFAHLSEMKYPSPDDEEYMTDYSEETTITIIDKGIEREFGKTLGSFTLLDLSSNNFNGTIPDSIGENLLKLHTLNLSNNNLNGPIPQSLAYLKNLEVLDLSMNRLSGEIPGILMEVTSLVILNVSYNNLSGAIPWGNQFGTFDNTSFAGNPRLCGDPLTKKCGNPTQSQEQSPVHNQEKKWSVSIGIVWITGMVGVASGLIIGVALEQAFGADFLFWLWRKWKWQEK